MQYADMHQEIQSAIDSRRSGVAFDFSQFGKNFISLDHVGVGEDKGEDLFADGGKAGATFDAVLFDLMEEGIFLLAVHTGAWDSVAERRVWGR